jgi:hypothetical protein
MTTIRRTVLAASAMLTRSKAIIPIDRAAQEEYGVAVVTYFIEEHDTPDQSKGGNNT